MTRCGGRGYRDDCGCNLCEDTREMSNAVIFILLFCVYAGVWQALSVVTHYVSAWWLGL